MSIKGSGVTRRRADAIISEITERAKEINENDSFAYRVAKVAVFGSYLNSDKAKLGDLDLAADLVQRYEGDTHLDALKAATNEKTAGVLIEAVHELSTKS